MVADVYRGLRSEGQGAEDVGRILSVMGHTHQRMARDFGDLSAVVEDPAQDWEDGGMTWRAFEFSKPGLRGGLSSRVICGESGPMHLQTDPMSQVRDVLRDLLDLPSGTCCLDCFRFRV